MDVLQSSMETMTKVKTLMEEGVVLNEKQCWNLLRNFLSGLKAIQSITGGSCTNVFDGATEDLFRIVSKARACIEECCKEDWLKAAVMQMDNKEAFRELLIDLNCCFDTICDICQCYNPRRSEEIIEISRRTTFLPTSIDEVEEDLLSLNKRLDYTGRQPLCVSKDVELAHYLMGRIRGLQKAKGGGLDIIVFPDDYPHPAYGSPRVQLGGRGNVVVYATDWLGLESATKVIPIHGESDERKKSIFKEAGISGGLSHPNIIKLFCCGFSEERKEFELVMERGKMDLSKMLEERGPLLGVATDIVLQIATDIMLQIASGMCYMHDMKVAHRDLKPENVVVNSLDASEVGGMAHVHVKLLDFDISKDEVKNTLQMPIGGNIGTPGCMAPEAMRKNPGDKSLKEIDALKADVFSFGMMCSEIVSGTKPFGGGLYCRAYQTKIENGERPELPNACSQELKSLISNCWCSEPSERPTFFEIYRKLTMLKKAMLQGSLEGRDSKVLWKEEYTTWIGIVLDPKQWWTHSKENLQSGLWHCFFFLWQYFAAFIRCFWFLPLIGEIDSTTPLIVDQENFGPSNQLVNEVIDKSWRSWKLIGVEKKIIELEGKLQNVGSLGIIGMGGIGKSTLVKALSSHISHKFEATCFVDELKDGKCRLILKDKLKDLQEQPQIHSLKEAQDILEHVWKSKKILIVVDDVRTESQLHDLLGVGRIKDDDGSKLIATSRTWRSLEQHVPMHGKVDMVILDGAQSMELFSMHAFAMSQSCLPYLRDVAKKIVSACDGLPLSLEVMGTHLYGNCRLRIWERTLHRLMRARDDGNGDERIWKVLEISFDDLNDDEKNMFLDVAYFFCDDSYPGWISEGKLLRILNDDVRISKQALDNLKDKSLLKVDNDGVVTMHDQLCDMGRMLAETKFGGSRDRELCLATFNECNQKGLELIQGLSFTSSKQHSKYQKNLKVDTMNFAHLRLLIFQHCKDFDLISTLVGQTFKLRCLMMHFSSEDHMVKIQKDSIDRFWSIIKHKTLDEMRVLCLDNCSILDSFPNESFKSISLTDLHLRNCKSLKQLTINLSTMTFLVVLHLVNCPLLEEIPNGLEHLIALKEMVIIKCTRLKTIFNGIGSLTCLKKLTMKNCEALEEFPSGLENMVALEELDLYGCKKLKELPEGFGKLICLKNLSLWNCEALEEFPSGLENLVALEEVDLSGCKKLTKLRERFGKLICLKKLYLCNCEALEEFPSGLENLVALEELDLHGCKKLKELPERFGKLICLKKLSLSNCEALKEFPNESENLVALEELNLCGCKKLKRLWEGFGKLICMKKLWLWNCEALEEFPSGLENLVALEEFPSGLENLVALEELNLFECMKLKGLWEGFGKLICLKKLSLWNCNALEEFPSGLGNLVALEELDLYRCKKLKELPQGFGELICLKKLRLWNCETLEEFSNELENLVILEELDLYGCKKLK